MADKKPQSKGPNTMQKPQMPANKKQQPTNANKTPSQQKKPGSW